MDFRVVENPSDKFFLVYLLLEIIVLLARVHLALNSGEGDVSEVILYKLKLFFMNRWVSIMIWGCMCHVFQFWGIGVICFIWYTAWSKSFADPPVWHVVYWCSVYYLQMHSPKWRVRLIVPLPYPEWITQFNLTVASWHMCLWE